MSNLIENKFFRLIWRVNAVLILLACVLVCLVCAVAGYYIIDNSFERSNKHTFSKADESNAVPSENTLQISSVEQIQGINIVRCELSTKDTNRGGSFSSGPTTATLNYLYYDLNSGASHWLVPIFNTVITGKEDFYFPDSPFEKRTVRWTSFKVAENGTNKDKSGSDLESYAVSKGDGTSYSVLLTDLDEVFNASLVGEYDLVVFYQKSGKSFVSRIDLKEQKVTLTTNLFDKK